jgi:predicted P-loop ATPase
MDMFQKDYSGTGEDGDKPPAAILPRTDLACDFLRELDLTGPWTLGAIEPGETKDNIVRAKTFATLDAARVFIDHYNGKWNLYYLSNRCKPDVTTTPLKEQITHLRCLHVDIDPPKSAEVTPKLKLRLLEKVQSFDPYPSFIVDSGGGYQAAWLFPEELPAHDKDEWLQRVEAINQGIAKQVGADGSVWNVNRWLRLPGTVNVLNATKRARGRTPGRAELVEATWAKWSIKEHKVPMVPRGYGDGTHGGGGAADYNVNALPKKLKDAIIKGNAKEWGDDRSDMIWFMVCQLIKRGWPDEKILPILLDPQYGCSAHCRDQSNPERYAQKQIDNARTKIGEDWVRSDKGQIITNSQANILRALNELEVRVGHNILTDMSYINGLGSTRVLTDKEIIKIRLTIDDQFGFLPEDKLLYQVVTNEADKRQYNPLANQLDKLEAEWRENGQQQPDLPETWLIKYAGAEDTPYTRAVSRLALMSAVRRARSPGCKHDEMLVLVSEKQGTGKSSALKILAMKLEYFGEFSLKITDTKKVIEQIRGKWILECSELAGIKEASIEHVKELLSRQVDRARMAYDRLERDFPRCCIFFGTTNTLRFLRDLENRRYWPVVIVEFDLEALTRDVEMLWGAAAALESEYPKDKHIELPRELWPLAAEVQSDHKETDGWAELLEDLLEDETGKIRGHDLWTILGVPPERQKDQKNLDARGKAMRELGWEHKKVSFEGKPKWCYVKGEGAHAQRLLYINENDGRFYIGVTPDESQVETREQADKPHGKPAADTKNEDIPF